MFLRNAVMFATTLLLSAAPVASMAQEWTVDADGQIYRLHIAGAEPVINKIDTWTLTLTDPAGSPVEKAVITVDGGMPAHGHGLPTKPAVTEDLGEGRYRLEGVKFNMDGRWVVKFEIDASNGTEEIQVALDL